MVNIKLTKFQEIKYNNKEYRNFSKAIPKKDT